METEKLLEKLGWQKSGPGFWYAPDDTVGCTKFRGEGAWDEAFYGVGKSYDHAERAVHLWRVRQNDMNCGVLDDLARGHQLCIKCGEPRKPEQLYVCDTCCTTKEWFPQNLGVEEKLLKAREAQQAQGWRFKCAEEEIDLERVLREAEDDGLDAVVVRAGTYRPHVYVRDRARDAVRGYNVNNRTFFFGGRYVILGKWSAVVARQTGWDDSLSEADVEKIRKQIVESRLPPKLVVKVEAI